MHATGGPGSAASRVFERRPKASHRDTVTYEIEMLSFCFESMTEAEGHAGPYKDLCIGGFLLHYRNLIRFFSGERVLEDDLSMDDPASWAERAASEEDILRIKVPALALDRKYFREISKYLQHCTLLRYQRSKKWKAEEMKRELDPIIAEFEKSFPR